MSYGWSWPAVAEFRLFPKERKPETTSSISTTVTTTTTTTTIKTTQSTIISRVSLTTFQTNSQPTANAVTTAVRSISSRSPSSPVNSTEKTDLSIRDTVFISLISSLAFLSISIIAAYCILIYLNQYLNKKKNSDRAALLLNRASLMTSLGSNSDRSILTAPLYRVTTPNNNPTKTNIATAVPRRSSTESIPLFRY